MYSHLQPQRSIYKEELIMPNWCENTLLIHAENKEEILAFLKTEYSNFDYNEAWVDHEQGYIDWNSPWSPPFDVIQALSAKFPNAIFILKFNESGMPFIGTYIYINGILKHKEDLAYKKEVSEDEQLC